MTVFLMSGGNETVAIVAAQKVSKFVHKLSNQAVIAII